MDLPKHFSFRQAQTFKIPNNANISMNKEEIITQIKKLHASGKPLNISAAKRRYPQLIEAVYALKPFCGWKGILEMAGVCYNDIEFEILDYITCPLCGEEYKNLTTHILITHQLSIEDFIDSFPKSDFISEKRRVTQTPTGLFGTKMPKGLIFPHWEPMWSEEYILDRVYEYHQSGFQVSNEAMRALESRLYNRSYAYIGPWPVVLLKLGITREEAEQGKNFSDINTNGKLSGKMNSRQEVIDAILDRQSSGLSVHSSSVTHGPDCNYLLYQRVKKWFGNWDSALLAAGIDVDAVQDDFKRRFYKYSSPEAVLDEIRNRYKKGWSLTYIAVQGGENPDTGLVRAARRYFSKWADAVTAAGCKIKYSKILDSASFYPTKESVEGAIRLRVSKGETLASQILAKSQDITEVALYRAALKHFGKWSTALISSLGESHQLVQKFRPKSK